MLRKFLSFTFCYLLVHNVVADEPSNQPRPTPLTRPEMKQMLEDMKGRKERIPTDPAAAKAEGQSATTSTAAATASANNANASASYEGRLSEQYLPKGGGARSYLNFSGSPARSANPNRIVQEPDPALTLDYAFKTRLFWIASRVNNCQYCLGHQESKLLATGMSDDQIAALDNDWSSYPANEQAAFALARKLTLEPYRLTDADIDACRPHFKDLQILEIILSVSGNNAINRWKEGIGVPQSSGGGNFGGTTGDHHSYLTETNPALVKLKSKITAVNDDGATGKILVVTKTTRSASMSRDALAAGLAQQAKRQPRLPLASEEQTRAAFGELVPSGEVPKWMRLLANFPIAGKRQVTSFVSLERDLDLDAPTRAALAHTIARQNGAWYSLAQVGDGPLQTAPTPKLQSLLTLAEHLAASPVVLTDAEVAEALKHWSPREVTQAIHYTAMRSLFDRMTEAAGL